MKDSLLPDTEVEITTSGSYLFQLRAIVRGYCEPLDWVEIEIISPGEFNGEVTGVFSNELTIVKSRSNTN